MNCNLQQKREGKMEAHSLNVADLDNSRNRYWGSRLAVVGTGQAFILVLIRRVSGCTSLFTDINNTLYEVFSGSIRGTQQGQPLKRTLSIFDLGTSGWQTGHLKIHLLCISCILQIKQ